MKINTSALDLKFDDKQTLKFVDILGNISRKPKNYKKKLIYDGKYSRYYSIGYKYQRNDCYKRIENHLKHNGFKFYGRINASLNQSVLCSLFYNDSVNTTCAIYSKLFEHQINPIGIDIVSKLQIKYYVTTNTESPAMCKQNYERYVLVGSTLLELKRQHAKVVKHNMNSSQMHPITLQDLVKEIDESIGASRCA